MKARQNVQGIGDGRGETRGGGVDDERAKGRGASGNIARKINGRGSRDVKTSLRQRGNADRGDRLVETRDDVGTNGREGDGRGQACSGLSSAKTGESGGTERHERNQSEAVGRAEGSTWCGQSRGTDWHLGGWYAAAARGGSSAGSLGGGDGCGLS